MEPEGLERMKGGVGGINARCDLASSGIFK